MQIADEDLALTNYPPFPSPYVSLVEKPIILFSHCFRASNASFYLITIYVMLFHCSISGKIRIYTLPFSLLNMTWLHICLKRKNILYPKRQKHTSIFSGCVRVEATDGAGARVNCLDLLRRECAMYGPGWFLLSKTASGDIDLSLNRISMSVIWIDYMSLYWDKLWALLSATGVCWVGEICVVCTFNNKPELPTCIL